MAGRERANHLARRLLNARHMRMQGTRRHSGTRALATSLLAVVVGACSSTSSDDGDAGSDPSARRDSGRDALADPEDASSADTGSDAGRSPAWDPSGMRVYLVGDAIHLGVRDDLQLFTLTCSNAITLQKKQGDAWIDRRDERPLYSQNPGHYLDGKYVPAMFNLGCDVLYCTELSKDQVAARAVEVVKTGTRTAPAGSNAKTEVIDVFETRPLEGPVRLRVVYSSTAPRCSDEREALLELTVPPGVCECGDDLDGGV